jgi:hypothetical protein
VPRPATRWTTRTIAAICTLCGSRGASALDAFELQVYDGTANAPGQPGIELHVNSVASGHRDAVAPELPPNHQTHLTLEPSLGITPWCELGAYLQTTVRTDGGFDYSGLKLRTKFVWPAAASDRFRWGVNLEISDLPPAYDRDRWGAELRPILAYTSAGGRLGFAFNPILDMGLTSKAIDQAPAFEPALSAVFIAPGLLSAGIELYGDLGPIGHFASLDEQQHTIFEVVNVLAWRRIELNAGVGEGLTAASNRLVFKMILGFQ